MFQLVVALCRELSVQLTYSSLLVRNQLHHCMIFFQFQNNQVLILPPSDFPTLIILSILSCPDVPCFQNNKKEHSFSLALWSFRKRHNYEVLGSNQQQESWSSSPKKSFLLVTTNNLLRFGQRNVITL